MEHREKARQYGVDSYLSKPVDLTALLAALARIHLQRHPHVALETLKRDGRTKAYSRPEAWTLDSIRGRISSPSGLCADLTARENRLLIKLAEACGNTVTRNVLLDVIGASDSDGDHRALEVTMSRLRKKLRTINDGDTPLRTDWGAGYMFAEHCDLIGR